MTTPLHLLLLEDSDDDALLVLRELKRGGFDVTYERLETAEAMHTALEQEKFDLVICDYKMPRFDGLTALKLLRQMDPDLPFLLVSGTIDEVLAVTAMKGGANDYVMKQNLARLVPAVARELREAEVRRERRRAERAQREAEAKYRAIVENMEDGLFQSTPEGRYVMANPALARIFGYASPEQLMAEVTDIERQIYVDPERRVEFKRLMAEHGRLSGFEYQARRKDGRVIWISENAQATAFYYEGTIRDVTERKRAEAEIKRQLERLAALRAIDTAITSSLDLRLTLDVVLKQVIAQLGVDAADVLLLSSHLQTLEYAAGRGFRHKGIERTRLRVGEGQAGHAALQRQTLSIPNLAEAEVTLAQALLLNGEDFQSHHVVPLITKGQVKGVLEVFHRAPLDPDPEWLNFLETLAGQAAIAIENTSLFDGLQRANMELILAYDATIEGWSRALDLRDKETEGHTQRVAEITERLARAMGLSEAELVHIRRGALLHDMGKMGVRDHILLKPGKLTDEEWVIMRKHPVYAYEMLSPIVYLQKALDIPYCHHEKWDGTGYPRGLKGEQIPLAARIFAVADVWDALRSDRPYRPAWPEEKVREYIRSEAGKHFEPGVVETFLRVTSGADERT